MDILPTIGGVAMTYEFVGMTEVQLKSDFKYCALGLSNGEKQSKNKRYKLESIINNLHSIMKHGFIVTKNLYSSLA